MDSAQFEDVYDGENLSRKGDVVVVSINHRLNSIGFWICRLTEKNIKLLPIMEFWT